jgi:hypothetical protein
MNKEILNIVNRILSEEITGKVKTLKNKIFENNNMKKQVCSECGGNMYEGDTCEECGNMYEDSKMCESCGSEMNEGDTCEECGNMYEGNTQELGDNDEEEGFPKWEKLKKQMGDGRELKEKLYGNQRNIDRNKNNRIDSEDFKLLRRGNKSNNGHKELEEKLYGNQRNIDRNKNNRIDSEDFKLLRRGNKSNNNESVVSMYELHLDESTGEKFIFNENDIINIIENIVLEEKKKSNKGAKNITKTAQSKSKSENDKYVKDVVKKMKDYLKDGSKGSFEMNPKHFPKGNGDLEKMDKMAYIPSDAAKEYIENFTGAALENIDYDEIHPNEEWVEDNIIGSSRTGNNPKWANAVETEVGERRNNIRKNNLLAVAKRKAYQKDDQPVKIDRSGGEGGDVVDKLLNKFSSKKTKNESVEDKKVITEIEKMKNLIGYIEKTQ